MAIIGPAFLGMSPFWYSTTSVNFTIDASDAGIAWIFHAPEDMTITECGVLQVTAVSAPTYKIGFMGTTTSGLPDGTYVGGASENSTTFTPIAGDDGVFKWYTLDNSYTVTRGQILCMALTYSSGTIGASNDCTWNVRWGQLSSGTYGFPYQATETAGTWSKDDEWGSMGYRTSTRSYGSPIQSFSAITYDANSSPDEYGIAFTLPTGSVTSYTVLGFEFYGDWNGNTVEAGTWTLYQDTTILQSMSRTGTFWSSAGKDRGRLYFDEATLSSLSPGTEYIIALTSSSVSRGWGLQHSHYAAAQDADGSTYLGLPYLSPRQATRTDAGAWSYSSVDIPQIFPIIYELST